MKQSAMLVRLAVLREDLARRDLAQAAHLLAQCNAALQQRKAEARDLAQMQSQRREVLRNPLLGSAQLRGSLQSVLTTFEADRTRETKANAAIHAAQIDCDKAAQALELARKALAQAMRLTEKRRRMQAPLRDALLRRAERREEAEQEELGRNLAPTGSAWPAEVTA